METTSVKEQGCLNVVRYHSICGANKGNLIFLFLKAFVFIFNCTGVDKMTLLTYNRWSKCDSKPSEAHENAMSVTESFHAHYLGSDVGCDRPIS